MSRNLWAGRRLSGAELSRNLLAGRRLSGAGLSRKSRKASKRPEVSAAKARQNAKSKANSPVEHAERQLSGLLLFNRKRFIGCGGFLACFFSTVKVSLAEGRFSTCFFKVLFNRMRFHWLAFLQP